MLAAKDGDLEFVQTLLPHTDSRLKANDGETALMHAVRSGFSDCVAALLPHSAPQACNAKGETAMNIAFRMELWPCLDVMSSSVPDTQLHQALIEPRQATHHASGPSPC